MSIRPIDMLTLQQMNEVTQLKNSELSRPVAQQINIAVQTEKQIEHDAEQVVQKSDVDNRQRKFDAKEKSDNEYHQNKKKDGTVKLKGKENKKFDVKV